MYHYLEEMKSNIHDVLNWNEYGEEIVNDEQALYDALWIDDYVTGNGSGSYTFNTAKAREYVEDNFKLLVEALREFGEVDELAEIIDEDKWEYADVTIRCYLLGQAVAEVMEEREEV